MIPTRKLRLTLVAAVLAAAGCSSSSSDVAVADNTDGGDSASVNAPVDGSSSSGTSSTGEGATPVDPAGPVATPVEPGGSAVVPVNPIVDSPDNSGLETLENCVAIDLVDLGTGSRKLTIALQAGERIELTSQPRGTVLSLDETLGEIQYVPPQGRAPDAFSYNIIGANNLVVSQGEMLLRLDPLRVMPLGDSITHGVEVGTGDLDSPPVPLRVGYRQSLLDQLATAGHAVDFTGQGGQKAGADAGISDTDNNGYPGVDISFINDRALEVFDELPSDVVLLHIGTNLTPDNAAGIDAILNTIDAWEAANFPVTVFVATLIPKRDPALQATVDQFNADLRIRVAARLSDNVVLVEQAGAVTVADIDPADVGVHPTAPGYLRMADTWFEAMASSALFPVCE